VNIVGALGRSKFKIPNSFHNATRLTKEKLRKNGKFYAKSVIDKIEFGFSRNFKTNDRRYMQLSLVV